MLSGFIYWHPVDRITSYKRLLCLIFDLCIQLLYRLVWALQSVWAQL